MLVRVMRESHFVFLFPCFWVFPQDKLLEAEELEIGTFKMLAAEETAQQVKCLSGKRADPRFVLAPTGKRCTS